MRLFINALKGYADKSIERWEQARMIAWYSAFDRKPFKLTDIWIPGKNIKRGSRGSGVNQQNKKDAYRILEKWNK